MSTLCNWLSERTGWGAWVAAGRENQTRGRVCLCRSLPCLVLFAFLVEAITGVFLLMRYCPSSQTAWESVYYLQHEIQGGWLLRAVHHYCGQAVLVLVGVWLLGIIVRGTYRAPREFVFWMVLFLALVTLALLLTGDLLSWDENGRSATLTRVGFLQALPGVGESLFRLAAGGTEFGSLTLAQFTTLHAIVFSGAFFVLLALRWHFARRAELVVERAEGAMGGSPALGVAVPSSGQALLNIVACLILLAVVFGCALAQGTSGPERGVPLGAPADPVGFYDAARPEWAFLGLYGFSKLDVFAGGTIVPIFVIPGVLVLFFLAMPFVGRVRLGRIPLGHVLNIAVTAVLLIGNVWLSFAVAAQDRADEYHQRALRESRQAAQRVRVLIAHRGGIPPAGALELLRGDPKTQGPILFRRHCAACHDHVGGTAEDIKAEESTAPNLFGYGSRKWLGGLLDPKRIAGPEYFGNTAFKRGQMSEFVKETFVDMEEEDREERDAIIMALSAQAKLPAQREADRKDAAAIAESAGLIGGPDGLCTDCHRFGQHGRLGVGPDLTGYASRDWMIGIVRNPADPRFYGTRNDRMQAYGATDDEAANLLTNREIELLVDWLRGDWFEP